MKEIVVFGTASLPIVAYIIYCFTRMNECPKGGGLFSMHDWVYKEDLECVPEGDRFHEFYMNLNGHNIISKNHRYVCSRCGEVEKQ